jgi:D-aminoacyl-tRNA deacylase
MRVLVQRVSEASVRVEDQLVGKTGPGLLLLVGVTDGDTEDDAVFLAGKIANLRIFEDDDGKMNLSAIDQGAGVLVVSQFTLYGDMRRGRRPSFIKAAAPSIASPLVDRMAAEFCRLGLHVESGAFGEHMMVHLVNDGPVTMWLDTDELRSS